MAITIKGRVVHQAGPWGSRRPLRSPAKVSVWLMNRTAPFFSATGNTGQNGMFMISFTPPAAAIDMYIQVDNLCSGEKISQRIPRPPNPNTFIFDDVGDITVSWEPEDATFAYIDITSFKDTQKFAKRLSEILKSPRYPVHINLRRESADGSGQDYTPAQRLLIPLKVNQPGFIKHLVEDISDELMPVKSETLNDSVVEILERFSAVDIKTLEGSKFLNRLLAAIQRAYPVNNSYSENLAVEPTHDMAAACAIVFIAGLMKKDKVQPTIMFPASSFKCLSGNGKTTFSKIEISVGKS